MTVQILDLTKEAKNPPPPKTKPDGTKVQIAKLVKGKVLVRDPKKIIGITIHQTACVFGPKDDLAARHRRALNVPSHALAFRDGVVGVAYPALWYMYHGNGLNAFSLGLEIEGHYPEVLDDPKTPRREDIESTWGHDPTPLDALTIETARAGLKFLYDEGKRLGCPLEYIWAHRQSNGVKVSDPGAGIWQEVVLDYGVAVLGLKIQPEKVWDDGKKIPASWSKKP